jgi:L-rhamnose mutarotase
MKYVSVMQLYPGFETEYQKRHDELWPDLSALLTQFGIANYSIYLHPQTQQLFASFEAEPGFDAEGLAQQPVMKKWWDYMADIMETEANNAPVATPLKSVFEFDPLPTLSDVCAVLDIGKTNVKLSAIRLVNGTILTTVKTENKVITDGPYPAANSEGIWQWFQQELKKMARTFAIKQISITTHGATIACMKDGELALPIMDYEFAGVDNIREIYQTERPDFSETFSPSLPAGLNLAAQLCWLEKKHSDAFLDVDQFLLYPQYWGYLLSGVMASEVTSLGCHTDLWNPQKSEFSSLVKKKNWLSRFPKFYATGAVLGTVRKELAESLGLPNDCQVINGIHDSNASLVPYLNKEEPPFTVVSSGTWTIIAGIGSPASCLDADKDMLANVNALGKPTYSIRFMGGREWDALKGEQPASKTDLNKIIQKNIFALPGFAQGGPFQHVEGKIVGTTEALSECEKTALATLYLALMIDYSLSQLQQNQTIFIEGAFARNELLLTLLHTLRPEQSLYRSDDATGTTSGTAMLSSPWREQWISAHTAIQSQLPDAAALQHYRTQWLDLLPDR